MIRCLILVLTLVLSGLETATAQDEVTFQGAIARGAGTIKSEQVGGEIVFSSGLSINRDRVYVVHPFTIPAGQSSVAYEKTLAWSLADRGEGYFAVSIRCTVNCERANISPYEGGGLTERFGEDERDNAYIANLELEHRYTFISGQVKLPQSMLADQNIELEVYVDYRIITGLDWTLRRGVKKISIPKGAEEANFTVPIDFRLADTISVGYSCVSSACGAHQLTKRGWLGDIDDDLESREMVTSQASSGDIVPERLLIKIDSQLERYVIPNKIELFRNMAVPIKVQRGRKDTLSKRVRGRIVVNQMKSKIECDNPRGIWNGMESCFLDSGFSPSRLNKFRKEVSETPFIIEEGVDETSVDVLFEPLVQNKKFIKPDPFTGKVIADYQYLSIICDEGCDQLLSGRNAYYLGEDRLMLGLSEASAHKFFLTSDFFNRNIVINLDRALTLNWLHYLLDDS